MKHPFILTLFFIFIVIPLFVTAMDFEPRGDIEGRGIYAINNFTNVTANDYICVAGTCYNSFSGSGTVTSVDTDNVYLYGGAITSSGTITFNESKLNSTIDARSSGTSYTNTTPITITANDIGFAYLVNQDLGTTSSPTFAGLSLTSNLAMGGNNIVGGGALSFTGLGTFGSLSLSGVSITSWDDVNQSGGTSYDNETPISLVGTTFGLTNCPDTQGYFYNSSLGSWQCQPKSSSGGGTVTSVSGDGDYVLGTITSSGSFTFNESRLNSTIQSLDNYTNSLAFTGTTTKTLTLTLKNGNTVSNTFTDIDTTYNSDEIYINEVANVFNFDESKMNDTIRRISVLATLYGTSLNTTQDMVNSLGSTGKISGGTFTDNGDGTLAVSNGQGMIRKTDSDTATLYLFNWSTDSSVSLTDNSINYIYVNYGATVPTVTSATSQNSDRNTHILLGQVYREGTDLHEVKAGQVIGNYAQLDFFKDVDINGKFQRASGFVTSETGTRNIAITAGKYYAGKTPVTTSSFDSSGVGTFVYYWRDGSGDWNTNTSQTQIDNLHYDDGSGTLATLTATGSGWWSTDNYGVHYVYEDVDGDVFVLFGQGDYTLQQAQDAQPPGTIPDLLTESAGVLAKVIIQKSSSTFTEIQLAFGNTFTPSSVQNHNDLSNIQGGAGDEYFHLNESEHTIIVSNYTKWDSSLINIETNLSVTSDAHFNTVNVTSAYHTNDGGCMRSNSTHGIILEGSCTI